MILLVLALLALPAQADERRSGRDTMSPALQAMAREANPAALWLAQGQELWAERCQSCHGDAAKTMRGVAARYPAEQHGRVLNLAQRIQAHALPTLDDEALLALTAFVASQSRGLPLSPPRAPKLDEAAAQGETLYRRRIGALNLACAHCHDERAGQRLGGSLIPQGHVEDYPLYRLEWQGLGSLQRRLRGCASGVRAAPFEPAELLALEVYLARRSAGMTMQAPGLRP